MGVGELKAIGFGDMRLWAVTWESDGRDVVLKVELGNGTRAELRCTWATNVRIDIAKRERGGPPMTWAGSIDVASDGIQNVSLDFASDGQLSLRCNDVVVTGW